MDRPPTKKKRLVHPDEQENEEHESSSQPVAPEKFDRKVSFAPSTETPPSQEINDDSKKKQPRLVMKKMVLNNFKSYAGRQVIGPFHKVNILLT
jgi:structural maintenance of chromosome 4